LSSKLKYSGDGGSGGQSLGPGYSEKTASIQGCRIAKRPDIRVRIAELRLRGGEVAQATVGINKAWVLDKLREVLTMAIEDRELATAAKVIIDIAKVAGVYVEKREVDWLMTWDGKVENITAVRLEVEQIQLVTGTE